MSAVSGLNAKAEKGRSKYVALDINSIYKGKSLENPKAAVQPKHGLQSLGKVGTGRRMPPPANLPSLKSENSGNNPNINLVPSGGQGWGSSTKEKGKTEETNGNQQQSPQSQPASSLSQTSQKTSTTNTVATSGVSKTWSSVTQNQEDGGQERNYLGQQSPFFPQEFPKLAGGDVPTDGSQKSSADIQYGPGPSLRPQTEGSWGRGTLQQPLQSGSAGGPQQSSGSGVNGPQPTETQQSQTTSQHLRDQRPYATSRGPVPSGNIPPGPVMGPTPPLGHGPAMPVQMGPGSALHPPPQFRGMMPSFMYGRNNYPTAYPSNYASVPPPPQSTRQPYPYPENRRPQPVRPLGEEEAYQRPAAIITEKALKGFDEILQNDTQDTWATSHGEIDYNAKLVFSDDEEAPANQKEKREIDDNSVKGHPPVKMEKEKEKKSDREKIVTKSTEERTRELDWAKDGRPEKRNERDVEWSAADREGFERDERWKSLPQTQQGRPPNLNIDMSRQWQSSQPPQQRPFDYRGPPPGSNYAPPHGRIGPGPVPIMQHGSYPSPQRPSRPGPRTPVADDDEMWRQRRKQHSEMTMTVERARQRRAEEEKHYEQSKQSAQEKAKAFDKGEKIKENVEIEDPDRSRHSSESREEKPPSRDGRERERDRDRSQPSYPNYNFSKQFQKNVPPRFQKQAAELMRQQQTQQPIPLVSPQPGGHPHFMRTQAIGQTGVQGPVPHAVSPVVAGGHAPPQAPLPIGVNYDSGWSAHPPPYMNQMPGLSPVSKVMPRPRSNSQGSATDSYESDRCTPEQKVAFDRERENYWNRDRRTNTPGYDNWHSSTGSNEGYFDPKVEPNKIYDQRSEFSRNSDKEEKAFDAHPRDGDRREKDFESQDYRYTKVRDSFKDTHKPVEPRESKEKSLKTNCWANLRDYDDRSPQDPVEESQEPSREKPVFKERSERYDRPDKERWDKDRPQRPDSRDSRASRDSVKEERHGERHEIPTSQPDRERKSHSTREEKKEKSLTFDWGDSPYPVESKRREWHHHHPPPITPKQFESIGPPKKNLTTLRRSNVTAGSQNIPEKKSDVPKDESLKKPDLDLGLKKEKEAKQEKNEKIKSESSSKEEKHLDDKFEPSHFDKSKTYGKDSVKKSDIDNATDSSKKDISTGAVEEKEKNRNEKDKHEHSRNEQNRDRRRDGRDRGSVNSRPRGGSSNPATNNPGVGNSSGGGRYETTRGRGGHNGRTGNFGNASGPPGNTVSGGGGNYRGKSREYRRSRVERGPRFDKQKERDKDKVKDDNKEKHSDDTSCSEVDEGKLGHLRQKDEDSEVSVDEASASTTESAQAEKYQCLDIPQEDKIPLTEQINSVRDSNVKNEKYQKEKRDSSRKDAKQYDDRLKEDKGGFAPRGEPSRRGRGGGGTLFRNSRGGPPRHGPSSYGPPPSKAGFGGHKPEKIEEQKTIEETFNDLNQAEFKTNISHTESTNSFSRESNKSLSVERPQQNRRPNRFEHLPPRFQKRNDRRYEKYDQPYRGRGRGRSSGFQGSSNKLTQGGKENLSDVGNEEWETASESSDIAERRDRRDDKDDGHKKDPRDKGGSSSSRKSFSSQRPINESNQGRRMNNESSRRGGQNNGDRNRQREGFPRDNRGRDGRGRQGGGTFGNGSDRRILNNNGNSSRPSSSAGHPGSVGGRNGGGRNNNPSTKAGTFQPKNEGTATVYRVDEIKLQDPNSVQAALTDLTNRKNLKTEVASAVTKIPKTDKDKAGALEGYDLNNYASVVIIDDHPEVEDNVLCGNDDGFQEVISKKRHKVMVENEVKKMKKEPHNRNKGGSRSRQSRLPPRFAKQRELVKPVSIVPGVTWELNVDISSKQSPNSAKDMSPAPPPPVNAWEKPITHSLRSHSPSLGVGNHMTSICSNSNVAIVNPNTSTVTSDVQVLTSSSKSSSFDRSDQHDSGIDVSDQPASAASSQRSSPSNDCKILTPTSSQKSSGATETGSDLVTEVDSCKPMSTVVFENKNFKAENAVLDKFGGQTKNQSVKDITASNCDTLVSVGNVQTKTKEANAEAEEKTHCLTVSFPSKESYTKVEEVADMKLDFTFDSGLEQLTDDKTSSGNRISNKSVNIGRSIDSSGTTVGVQSPISPSTDDLNLKIASVKKVWENDPPLPTVMEHPQTSDDNCPTSYGSFSSSSDPSANVYNSSVDVSSQIRKETDSTEMSFRENSSMQQACSNSGLVKNIDHTVSSMKSHMQLTQHNPMAGQHCSGPLSPPLISGLETMAGIRTIAGLASSVQVAGIPAIPSPPTVLFNSSQQMAQTGIYQPLQMDNRQNQAAAVAAAMVQYSQSPHGYAPMGTYGLSHQPPQNPQLSNAYGQQSLFVQPSAAHQGQDIYSSNQFRVQPPYPQSQHVSSNQVLSAQQNIANSHLLGSQLVQTRATAGPSPAAPHLQSLHGLQAVQPGPQTSYFSTSAQPQTASFYHQPAATPASPMQQQPHFPSHQGYGSQSTLNVLPQAAAVTQNFRNFGSHQFKAASNVMNNMVPDSSNSLRAATRSPTVDATTSRNMFGVSTSGSSTMNSSSVVTVPQISSSNVVGKIGQLQTNPLPANRLSSTTVKSSQYSLPQTQQHYYPFGQQKFGHVQSNTVRPQVLFPNVVRNAPHQAQHHAVAATTNLHYPPPIQRPGATVAQPVPQPPPAKVGIRPPAGVMVPGGKLTSAQQAKLRAEAVQQTHMFFVQSKTGKHEDNVPNILTPDGSASKLSLSSTLDDDKEKQAFSSNDTNISESKEGNDMPPTVEE